METPGGRGSRLFPMAIVALLASMLPATPAGSAPVRCPRVAAPALRFGKPVYIDRTRPGGEPVSQVAQDGSILVGGHASTSLLYKNPSALPGLADWVPGYANQTYVWRSTDRGKSWKRIEAIEGIGAHTLTSTGFSDPDFAMDEAGTIYGTEIDLANVAIFSSSDDGQTFPLGNPLASAGDRPWLGALEAGEVFVIVNLPEQLLRSTDGGITFLPVNTNFVPDGHLFRDPLNPKDGLIGPDGGGAAISADDGETWKRYPLTLDPNEGMRTVAVDRAGWIYSTSAGGYEGTGTGAIMASPEDNDPDGVVRFSSFNRKTRKWTRPLAIPTPKGDALWPWIAAGDDGRVVVVWLQSLARDPRSFYVYAAYSTNGHGSSVRCSDGKRHLVPPSFRVVNASGRPVHVGDICIQGTACNADPEWDRRLGDYFSVNIDPTGAVFVVVPDTRLTTSSGGPKPIANPLFIRQSGGTPAYARPLKTRPTRPAGS